jgi:hypothetical protein
MPPPTVQPTTTKDRPHLRSPSALRCPRCFIDTLHHAGTVASTVRARHRQPQQPTPRHHRTSASHLAHCVGDSNPSLARKSASTATPSVNRRPIFSSSQTHRDPPVVRTGNNRHAPSGRLACPSRLNPRSRARCPSNDAPPGTASVQPFTCNEPRTPCIAPSAAAASGAAHISPAPPCPPGQHPSAHTAPTTPPDGPHAPHGSSHPMPPDLIQHARARILASKIGHSSSAQAHRRHLNRI